MLTSHHVITLCRYAANETALRCLGGQPTRQISDDELNRSINAFCKNGADIKGFGKYSENMIDYPPKGETQFYPNDRLTYHLTFGASTVNQGEPNPYKDMGWCKYV